MKSTGSLLSLINTLRINTYVTIETFSTFFQKGEVPFIAMGTVDDVEVGEWVIAVGSPLNLHNTFTVGVVSNKSRSIRELSAVSGGGHHLDPRMEYIQTDASINVCVLIKFY